MSHWPAVLLWLLAYCAQTGFVVSAPGTNNTLIREDVRQRLIDNDAAGAALVVQQNVAPAVAAGTDPYPTDTLEYIIIGAASAIATSKSQQQTIDSAVQFLALLKSVNETLLSERLTQTFEDELNYSQIGTRRAPEYTSEVLLLSLSAGLKSAVYKDFAKAKDDLQTVQLVASVVNNTQLNSTLSTTARDAVVSAYGGTQHNLQQAQGNVTTVGSLLFNSAYLAPFLGGSSAASQNISDTLSQTSLTLNDMKESVAAACTLGLQQREPKAVAVLASAALSASDASGIQAGFANATMANLNTMCNSQVEAQRLGAAVGQAVQEAIPSTFGPNPCALFEGSVESLYNSSSTVCDPPLRVNYIRTGIAIKSDCIEAITQLRANFKNVADCSTLNITDVPSGYSGNSATPLMTVRSCQVLLDAKDGQRLSCFEVAEYASDLAVACSNSQMGTGGRVYPFTSPNGYSPGTGVILSRTTSHV